MSPSATITVSAGLSIAHKALYVSEIQDRIFSFNEEGDAARCATVCNAWKEVALDHVWHTLRSLRPLFSLLAPLVPFHENPSKGLVFTRKLKPSDWTQFSCYAKRVRMLFHLPKSDVSYSLMESALGELLRSRLNLSILPNLEQLYFSAPSNAELLQYAALFLHERLRVLCFVLAPERLGATSNIEIFLEEIKYRAPRLRMMQVFANLVHFKSFRVDQLNAARVIEDALSQALVSQMHLEQVWLNTGTLTTMILGSLSRLPKLERIALFDKKAREGADLGAIATISWPHYDGEIFFPALRLLDLQTRVASVASLISCHSNFSSLQMLNIDMVCQNDARELQKCLEVISSTCKKLVILEFTRFQDAGNRPSVLAEERTPITKEVLAPITALPCLSSFSITHTQPIVMSDDDLVELLSSCPPLTKLHLNPSPIQSVPSSSRPPSLEVLHSIAQCQPRLKHLSLCLEARCEDLPCSVSILANPFEDLRTLSLGKSVVGDVDRTALYLSQILPIDCELRHDGAADAPTTLVWAEVTRKLPLFTMFCSEQRKRIRELEEMVVTCHATHKKSISDAVDENFGRNGGDQERESAEIQTEGTAVAWATSI